MAEDTRQYLLSLKEAGGTRRLPVGPVLLGVNSVLEAVASEIIHQNPEQHKIEKLQQVQAIFKTNPLYAGYGNQDSDAIAYKTVGLELSKIFDLDEDSSIKNLEDLELQTIEEH